jgi:hypothetical protein
MRPNRGDIHLYHIYELFGIPSHRWLECLPLQTTVNHDERREIGRYLAWTRSNR